MIHEHLNISNPKNIPMFQDRQDAGQQLAQHLLQYKNKKEVLVLGIPRGGIVVAAEVAKQLHAPLDILVIKKLGAPGNEELAIGAVSVDSSYLDKDTLHSLGVSQKYLQKEMKKKQQEAKQRVAYLREKKSFYSVKNKIVILVDDGIATGATMIMAIQIMKKQAVKKIIIAVPVAPSETINKLHDVADEVICLQQPILFFAIGQFYHDFQQVEDEEVKRYLQ